MNETLKLIAPWWYWDRQKPTLGPPRNTRPTIQKFDQADFVPGFTQQPQHSLKFVDDDFVYTYQSARRSGLGSLIKLASGFPPPSSQDDGRAVVSSGVRKLFLDIHKRHYVVVCELRCEAPGFPRELTADICQAGFVIRRRLLNYQASAAPEAKALLLEIGDLQRQLADYAELRPLTRWATTQRNQKNAALIAAGTFGETVSTTTALLKEKRTELLKWKVDSGADVVEEGWFSSGFDPIGSWQVVEAAPATVDEQWYPLYPLHDDPSVPDHEARRHSLYFGVIPTTALESDKQGIPKLDSRAMYQLRCFVRRHKEDCPRTNAVPDCHGPVFWSQPTEPYQLAGANDLTGTSHRPITIELPDLDELAALATPANLGRFSPVRMVSKQSLLPGGLLGFGSICFFSIPLITIVATFVLSLFLPIVVFIFGLWFLLALKFCIPPSISLDVGVMAEIDAALALPNLDAAASVTFTDPTTALPVTKPMGAAKAELAGIIGAGLAAMSSDYGVGKPISLDPNAMSNSALFNLAGSFSAVDKLAAQSPDGENPNLDLTANLAWEPRVTVEPSPT